MTIKPIIIPWPDSTPVRVRCSLCCLEWDGSDPYADRRHTPGACAQRQIAEATEPLKTELAELKQRIEALEKAGDDGK